MLSITWGGAATTGTTTAGGGGYLITMTLADRAKPILGRLVGDKMELSAIGAAIDAHIRRIGEFTPEIEVLGAQVMPDHIYMVLRVKRRMARPLGIALRGFKGGASKLAGGLAVCTASPPPPPPPEPPPEPPEHNSPMPQNT